MSISVAPQQLAQIQADFFREHAELLRQAQSGTLQAHSDRRFQGDDWKNNPFALLNAHLWDLSGRTMNRMVEAADVSQAVKNRLRFSIMQWLEATAPSNFLLTNPEVQRTMFETK